MSITNQLQMTFGLLSLDRCVSWTIYGYPALASWVLCCAILQICTAALNQTLLLIQHLIYSWRFR